MRPHITFGMKFRRLFHPMQPINLRQNLLQQPGPIQQLKCEPCMALRKHARQLIPHALIAHLANIHGMLTNGSLSPSLNLKPKPRRKPNRPQHPQLILAEPHHRIANRPNQLGGKIIPSAHIIQNRLSLRIEQHSIDREVAPHHIFPRILGKPHCIRTPPIRVSSIAAKCSHLGHNLLAIDLIGHQNHAKVSAHGKRPRKQTLHNIRTRRSSHIKIRRSNPEQQITHTTTGKVSVKAFSPQTLHNAHSRNLCK